MRKTLGSDSSKAFLGLAYNKHDSAAAIVVGSRIVAAAQEERFNRVKHSGAFPKAAIEFCLQKAELKVVDLAGVGYYWQPWRGLLSRIATAAAGLPGSLRLLGTRAAHRGNMGTLASHALARHTFRRLFGRPADFKFVEHHLCHAATAFYPSEFDTAAILTMDLSGEVDSCFAGRGSGSRIEKLWTVRYPHSLGAFYSAITQFLGFQTDSEEYLVMGLAAYGRPTYYEDLRRLVTFLPGGKFKLNLGAFVHHQGGRRWYSRQFETLFGWARQPDEDVLQPRFCDLAASAQQLEEAIVLHMAETLAAATQVRSVCLGGGVALNAAVNQSIIRSGLFDRIFVGPAPNDAGAALGAALNVELGGSGRVSRPLLRSSELGPAYCDSEIESVLKVLGLRYEACGDPAAFAATHLARGNIVGWFQGRMEFGPRALGFRSILAAPAPASIRDRINHKIKFRHPFRPFGAAIKSEAFPSFFELSAESRFMMQICRVRPEKREVLAAVTHVDGTCRPQTVRREESPLFWSLLDHFEQLSGLPVILNTSFNLAGEPIVCSPIHATDSFLRSGIDVLIAGSWAVYRTPNAGR